MLSQRVEQGDGLELVTARARALFLLRAPAVDGLLNARDDEALSERLDRTIAKLEGLGEVVARVDVQDRERKASRTKRLLREVEEEDRVLASAEQEDGSVELRRELAEDSNGLGFEGHEVGWEFHCGRESWVLGFNALRPGRRRAECRR